MRKIKRLFFDIETSPGTYWAWRPGYNINLSYKNQLTEAKIICVSWLWEGSKKVHHLTWDKDQDDKKLIAAFVPVLESADEICGHNSDAFDLRWVRTRAIKHGIPMSPDFVAYDTWKEAKKMFRFDSNTLDYISTYIGAKKKKETGGSKLWTAAVFDKCPKALKEMISYCDNDVVSQSEVFEIMKPYIKSKAHYGEYISQCPECGSDDTHESKRRPTAQGHKKVQFQCFGPHPTKKGELCGKYHTVAASRFDKEANI